MHVEIASLRVVRSSYYITVEIPYRDANISIVIIMLSNFSKAIVEYRNLVLKALGEINKSKSSNSSTLSHAKI